MMQELDILKITTRSVDMLIQSLKLIQKPGNASCLSLIVKFHWQGGNESDQTLFEIDGPWEFLLENAVPNRDRKSTRLNSSH